MPRDSKKGMIGALGIPRDSKKRIIEALGIPRDSKKGNIGSLQISMHGFQKGTDSEASIAGEQCGNIRRGLLLVQENDGITAPRISSGYLRDSIKIPKAP